MSIQFGSHLIRWLSIAARSPPRSAVRRCEPFAGAHVGNAVYASLVFVAQASGIAG
jgi:hypothetical protein